LDRIGNITSDGRPILGIDSRDLLEITLDASERSFFIPAHVWTPWFSVFGSKSGFDSVEECFGDKSKFIHALETGLSSDPAMNWRLSKLDRYTLISNSDSHSFWPWRIGREANVFEMDKLDYSGFIKIIREKDTKRFLYTIEVDPSYGKYHLDGHRDCNVCLEPKESIEKKGICPVCKRSLTIGVLNRVEELADRPEGFKPDNTIPYKSLMPLSEIISSVLGIEQLYSKKIWDAYNKLINAFGTEFEVLIRVSETRLKDVVGNKMAEAIVGIRDSKVKIRPGYDGVYGKALFDVDIERVNKKVAEVSTKMQKSIADFG